MSTRSVTRILLAALLTASVFATAPSAAAQAVRASGFATLDAAVPPFEAFSPGTLGYSFLVPADGAPSFFDDVLVGFEDISARFQQGATVVSVTGDLSFYVESFGGGFLFATSEALLNVSGPPLFSGTTSNPQFLTGSFAVTNFNDPPPVLDVQRALTLTAVPEPASVLLLIGGMLPLGFVARRRRSS